MVANFSSTARGVSPGAVDVRADADGKQGAKLKLVASLLGIDLDRLKRREVQRRNRRLLVIATTATVGMVFSIGLAAYAFQQQQRAQAEAETSRQVTEFLLSTFKQADPAFYRSAEPSVGEMLQQSALRVRHELHDQPEVRARLMATIGSAFVNNSRGKEAAVLLSEALVLQEQRLGQDHRELVPILKDLAAAYGFSGDVEAANRLITRALEIQEQNGSADVEIAASLVRLSIYSSDDEAESILLRALDLVEAADPESVSHGDVLVFLAGFYMERGELEKCPIYLQQAAKFQEEKGLREDLIHTLSSQGNCLGYMGKSDEAIAVHTRSVSIAEDIFGVNHPWTAFKINNLAVQHHIADNLDDALMLYQRVVSIAGDSLGPQSGVMRIVLANLGELERDRGSYVESEAFFAEAVRLELEVKGQVPAYLKGQIALLRLAEKRYDEARQEFERYFQSFDDGKLSSNPLHLPIIEGYEQLLREIGQAQE